MVKLRSLVFVICLAFVSASAIAQGTGKVTIDIDRETTYQTIQNFGASDAWACQFAGNWPEDKKNKIADWLFSTDTLDKGNPKGIGLSIWRYNFGAGSAEQNEGSGIKDEWRRAALTTGNSTRTEGQNWFLQAAKKRGVKQFLGFFNSPPVALTRNGKAFAVKGSCNIDSSNYKAFADYTVKAIKHIRNKTGVMLDYISPVNEPQWDWSDGGQEGCPYKNVEISGLVKAFSKSFSENNLPSKLLVTESGSHVYLLKDADKPNKGNQIFTFFNAASPYYIGGLPNVSQSIASHSYFTTSPLDKGFELRAQIRDSISKAKNIDFWQSEYCILGNNEGEIEGDKRDLGMGAALYLAKVIYQDLAGANAAAWHWWTALSAYDYKDGLVYIDKKENDGQFTDSKMLWVLGNYSLFIRPGMQRIEAISSDKGLHVSAFKDVKGKIVIVVVNATDAEKPVAVKPKNSIDSGKLMITYTTSATGNLQKNLVKAEEIAIPANSVVSIVFDY
jgi:O-glycosyl hydrolase